jgi:hypothetical protein
MEQLVADLRSARGPRGGVGGTITIESGSQIFAMEHSSSRTREITPKRLAPGLIADPLSVSYAPRFAREVRSWQEHAPKVRPFGR